MGAVQSTDVGITIVQTESAVPNPKSTEGGKGGKGVKGQATQKKMPVRASARSASCQNTQPIGQSTDLSMERDGEDEGEAVPRPPIVVPKLRVVISLTRKAGPALAEAVGRLEGMEKVKRIRELNSLNIFELEWVENIANTQELKRRLDAGESIAALGLEYLAPETRGLNEPSPLPSSFSSESDKSAPPATPSLTNTDKDGVEDSLARPSSNTPPPLATATATDSLKPPTVDISPPPVCIDMTGWPSWLREHYEQFNGLSFIPDNLKETWEHILGYWMMFEHATEFVSPVSCHSMACQGHL